MEFGLHSPPFFHLLFSLLCSAEGESYKEKERFISIVPLDLNRPPDAMAIVFHVDTLFLIIMISSLLQLNPPF